MKNSFDNICPQKNLLIITSNLILTSKLLRNRKTVFLDTASFAFLLFLFSDSSFSPVVFPAFMPAEIPMEGSPTLELKSAELETSFSLFCLKQRTWHFHYVAVVVACNLVQTHFQTVQMVPGWCKYDS